MYKFLLRKRSKATHILNVMFLKKDAYVQQLNPPKQFSFSHFFLMKTFCQIQLKLSCAFESKFHLY